MVDPKSSSTPELTDDQLAVSDYMASRNFRRARRSDNGLRLKPHESFIGGTVGLAVNLVVVAVLLVVAVRLIEDFLSGTPNYLTMMFVIQTISLPPMICFSFAVATATFWYGPVTTRVLTGLAMTLPGFGAFLLSISLAQQYVDDEMAIQTGSCLFAQFMAGSTVSLLTQFFGRWTLSHRRALKDGPIQPTGLRSFFELTLFFAVGFTIIIGVFTEDFLLALVFFTIWGTISTAAIISVMIASLREESPTKSGWFIALGFSFACAAMINGFYAVMLFSWDAAFENIISVLGMSLYGAAVIAFMFAICLGVLKYFGWTCVNRRAQVA